MAFGASLFFFVFHVTLYLRESSSFVFATNLTRIGLKCSEDEGEEVKGRRMGRGDRGWEEVLLSGGGSR